MALEQYSRDWRSLLGPWLLKKVYNIKNFDKQMVANYILY